MAVTLQNLRAVTTGVSPAALLPGQLCFNLADKILFVGDGSDFKTSFDGVSVPGVAGEGWFSLPLDYADLGDYYLFNPAEYGPAPTNGQVLAYSSITGKPYWEDSSALANPDVYVTTNTEVAAAPGSSVSAKITAAIGVVPNEGDVTIVSGVPGDQYQGLYYFQSGVWTFAAGYANPTASQVVFDPSGAGLPPSTATVQEAIDLTWALANNAETTALAALPLAGGVMTGDITFNDGQLVDAGTF